MTKFVWRGIEDEALETVFLGRTWQANVPQDIDDNACEEQAESVRNELPDGSIRMVSKIVRVKHVDMLRRNFCFDEVGAEPKEHKKRGRPPKIINAAEEHGGKILTVG